MCTGIRLTARDTSVVYGRTMEFGQKTESEILMIPRNYTVVGTAPQQNKGFVWETLYAAVGANMLQMTNLVDGVNEKGLAGGLFYFPGYAGYQAVSQDKYSLCLAPWELLTWLLTTCASVEEARRVLPTIFVGDVEFPEFGGTPEVHWVLHDAAGESIVIEYVNGILKVYDNPLGVCTNAPTFDWHMTNLNNYVKIFSINAQPLNLSGGVTLTPFGQGSGMLGLPGDFTPPSRFVRAVAFSQSAVIGENAEDARCVAFHILNLFDIPLGVISDVARESTIENFEDYTQWTVVSDLHNKRYYWHTYNNSRVYKVDLMKMDIDGKQPQKLPMHCREEIADAYEEIFDGIE